MLPFQNSFTHSISLNPPLMSNRTHYYPHSLFTRNKPKPPWSHNDSVRTGAPHSQLTAVPSLFLSLSQKGKYRLIYMKLNFWISVLYLYFVTLNSFKLIFLFVVSCPGRQMTNLFRRENLPTRLLCHFLRFNTSHVTPPPLASHFVMSE